MNDFDATMIVEGRWDLTMVDYEPSKETFAKACQHLINTGLAWKLQGYFGRICKRMIEVGVCHASIDRE